MINMCYDKQTIKLFLPIILVLFIGLLPGPANSAVVLDFEGLRNLEQILDFYNGGTGSLGSDSGRDYGISFGPNALALIDSDDGGSGNFGGEPSPPTTMFFLNGSPILTRPTGFDTGFSLSYTAINEPGVVKVYEGRNATGKILAEVNLPVTDRGDGDPTGAFSPFYNVGVPFDGTAKSIEFGGSARALSSSVVTI